jgi:predicted nucleotidyltransferase
MFLFKPKDERVIKVFYREALRKAAKQMRAMGEKEKSAKQQLALISYRERLIQIAQSIAKEESNLNSALEAAVIVGSIARGNYNLKSDLDLYLIYASNQPLTLEERNVDHVEVELFKVGYKTLAEELQTGQKAMFLLKDGLLVYENEKKLGSAIIEQAKTIYETGVEKWDEVTIEQKKKEFIMVRQKVRKLMEKAEDGVAPMLILSRYTLLAIEVFYNLRGLWQPNDKDVYDDLKERSPEFADTLQNCLQQWLPRDRFNYWLRLTNYAFEPVGGLPNDDELKIKD